MIFARARLLWLKAFLGAWHCFITACALIAHFGQTSVAAEAARVDFNRTIRPLLSDNCYACHGPDEEARKAGLRLDLASGALEPRKGGGAVITPGAPERSEFIARIKSQNPDHMMPPPASGKSLSAEQLQLLESWVRQGAVYQEHWAYVQPQRFEPPKTSFPVFNEIDHFIRARLEEERLQPSPPADPHVLARRLALDLTGLPPAAGEVDEYAANPTDVAFGKLVDTLLSKPSFGEHWARMWLDLARYADSMGYADDPARTIWAYRDYVIRAFNSNTPFDRFTIEQIAGDLLHNPSEDNLIATAFHRNTMNNNEGGTDDEEFRNAAVVDRVNTTFTVWMGTSMACAQCHTHKYDPISHKEYFQVFAIFNNTEDADRPDEAPVMKIFTEAQKKTRANWQNEAEELQNVLTMASRKNVPSIAHWEREFPLELLWQGASASARPIAPGTAAYQYAGAPASIHHTLALSASERTEVANARLVEYYAANIAPELEAQRQKLRELSARLAAEKPTTVPVLRELPANKRRNNYVHLRGNYMSLGDGVTPGVPDIFHPISAKEINRLSFAQWLVAPENPLTARVAANRFWEQLFGNGLVRTSDDFGAQGDMPVHPELLDWLATELVRSGWDVKAFLKLLVTSATYRQSSRVTPELLERDPENALLTRGPRTRLTGEVIRDQALRVSGLLSEKMYGPPIRPARPALGLSAAFGSSLDWKVSDGEDQHRRALYIEWRRTSPYPSLATFDAPSREVCVVNRPQSNTPLQALVTLNDPVFVETAQALGRRMLQHPASDHEKIAFGFQLCLVRPPRAKEIATLETLLEDARRHFSEQDRAARSFATDPIGPLPAGVSAPEAAAWTALSNVLLNLDETLMPP